jgi:hypothetical protein
MFQSTQESTMQPPFFVLIAAAALNTFACSSARVPASSSASDAGLNSDGDAANIDIDAGPNPECNAVAQEGASVSATGSTSAAPKPTGGTTVDGIYVLTTIVGYGSAQAIPYKNRSTLEARGLIVNVVEDTGKGDVRKTGSGVVTGTTLTLTETCAFPKRRLLTEQASFTASATEILLYGASGGITFVQTFTKK